MNNKKRVAKAKKSLGAKKGPRGRAGGAQATPAARKKNSHARRDFRVIREEGKRDRESGNAPRQLVKKHRNVPPSVRRRRRLAAFLMLLAAAGLVTYLLLGPILRNMESHRNLVELENKLEAERAETRELEGRKERAQSKEYVENEAREMNYVKPGEIPIVVLDDQETPGTEAEVPAQPQTSAENVP